MYKLSNFSNVKILIVGDVMIDKYLWGEVTRISPEAPVPVVRLEKTSLIAGGAANVAANIAGLGATPYLIGVVGDDSEGASFAEILTSANISADYLICQKNRGTTVKTRIIAHRQQLARLDQETTEELSENGETAIWQKFCELAGKMDGIIISDYGKGVLTSSLTRRLIRYAKDRGKTVMVDPKGRSYQKYAEATLITPNKFEMAEVGGCADTGIEELSRAGQKILAELKLEAVVITRGEEGMTLIEKNQKPLTLSAAGRKIFDVTGAGDTFIAALAVAVGAGEDYRTACEIANTAAGLAVEEIGTTRIMFNALKEELEK